MGAPSPTIPSFLDGTVVHQASLNALASNLTNLYTYILGSFSTQSPCVIATQTTGQVLSNATDTLIGFQTASVNTDNMFVTSQPTQLTVQTAGIYLVFAQIHWPGNVTTSAAEPYTSMDIMINGTLPATNGISHMTIPAISNATNSTPGGGAPCAVVANLALGSVIYLNGNQNYGGSITLPTSRGAAFLGAIYLTSST